MVGLLYLNSRNYVGEKCRVGSWSHNKGDSFQEGCWEEELIEPVCQASLIRYTEEILSNRNRILFSNPASMNRERMTSGLAMMNVKHGVMAKFYTQDRQLIPIYVWMRSSGSVVYTNEGKLTLTKQFHSISLIWVG